MTISITKAWGINKIADQQNIYVKIEYLIGN